jgi:hypothetical protein
VDRPSAPTLELVPEVFNVIDCDVGRGWTIADREIAGRLAAGHHAATGNVVEVIMHSADADDVVLLLPPADPKAR